MDLRVTFLGTGAAAPTQTRNVAATLLQRGPDRVLVDCGEGTQRQLQWSYAGLSDLERVLLTHNHADHYLGLPGLLKSYANRKREAPLHVYGPPGTWMLLQTLAGVIGRLPFEMTVKEFEGGEEVWGLEGYKLRCLRVDHRMPALGWILEEDERPGRFDAAEARRRGCPDGPLMGRLAAGEDVEVEGRVIAAAGLVGAPQPGRKVVLSGDTRPCAGVREAAQGADLLVHEGTFLDTEAEEARKSAHTTVREAAELARDAGVKMLALTHLSARYTRKEALAAATAVLPGTVLPDDFDQVLVPYRERGAPELVRLGGLDHDALPPFRRR